MSSALLTDRYELTMLDAAIRAGTHDRDCVFEVFARRLPGGRRYGIVAGAGRLLDLVTEFRFGDAELGWLRDAQVVDTAALDWLADCRFGGSIFATGITMISDLAFGADGSLYAREYDRGRSRRTRLPELSFQGLSPKD